MLPGEDSLFNFLDMNTKQAKAAPLHEFLARLGHQPTTVRGNDLWYKSPFRLSERTPSFKIDRAKNVWYDHGLGVGGTIIDFVQQLNQVDDISRVLSTIEDVLGKAPLLMISLPPVTEAPREQPMIEFVGPIADPKLEAYLGSRAIPVDLARVYLQEITYRVEGNRYRALAFANEADGYEVRNAAFKGSVGKKAITYLVKQGSTQAAVFEGVFDFLSVLAHHKRDKPNANVLVLNSVALLPHGIERLSTAQVQKLYTYLDHDDAGKAALQVLQALPSYAPDSVIDASGLYLGHKDANAFLQHQRL